MTTPPPTQRLLAPLLAALLTQPGLTWAEDPPAARGVAVPQPRAPQARQVELPAAAEQRNQSSNILSVQPVGRYATDPAAAAPTAPAPAAPAAEVKTPPAPAVPTTAEKSPPALSQPTARAARPKSPATAPAPAAPEEQPLWALLEQQRHAEVLEAVSALERRHPDWQPPPELLQLAREGLRQQRIRDLIAGRSYAALAALAAESADAFGCDHIDQAWALADAYRAVGRDADLQALLAQLVPGCPKEADRLATLYKAKDWLSVQDWARLLEAEASAARSAPGEAAYRQLRYEYRLQGLIAASQGEDTSTARLAFEEMAADIEQRRDSGAALIGAWLYFRQERYADAAGWFEHVLAWAPERTEALEGLAMTRLKQRQWEAAETLAQQLPATRPQRAELLAGIALARAQTAYEAKDYAAALHQLEAAQRQAGLPRYARLQRGWALYQLKRFDAAAAVFSDLYREQPDEQSAEGALLSLLESGRQAELQTLAQSGPLGPMLDNHNARQWFSQKKFLAAKQLAPDSYEAMGAAGTPRLTLYSGSRDKSGQQGLSQLRQTVNGAEGAWSHGSMEFKLKTEQVSLDSGPRLDLNTLAGNLDFSRTDPATLRRLEQSLSESEGAQTSLHLRNELPETVVELEIGQTPGGAELASTLTGEASIEKTFGRHTLKAGGYIRPVKESLLSYTGFKLPEFDLDASAAGRGKITVPALQYGRVTRNGAELSTRIALDPQLALGARVAYETVTGVHVKDNDHVALEVSLSKSLDAAAFDYVALGFGVGYEHYARNLSFFTPGQGGYFSPQQYWHWGPSLDMMTKEGKNFLIKAHVEAGGLYKREADSPLLPLSDLPLFFAGSSDTGLRFSADLQGVLRLNDYVQIGASLVKRSAPDYDDASSFGFLRILFAPRKSVLSADLPGAMAEGVY